MRKRFLEGFHYDAHPMGMLVSAVAALSTFYPDAKDIDDPDVRDKQIVRLIAKMPTLAAGAYRFSVGHAVRLPGQLAGLHRELPVDDVEDRRAPPWRDPVLAQALDVLFILHADHEQNCSHDRHAGRRHRPTPTPTPPRRRPPPPSTAPATAAPTRP